MGFLFHKPKAQATKTDKINSIRVSQSVLGQTLPIVFGVQRLHMSLIWYGDFTAIAHTEKQQGGKGMGGHSQTSTSYTYQAALIAAFAQGPLKGIVNVWDSKGRFTQAMAQEQFTVPGGGGSYQVGNHAQFQHDAGVGANTHYHMIVDDFGSDGPTTLDGYYNVPLDPVASAPGTGQYTYDPGTGTYTFSPGDAGKLVTITYTFNMQTTTETEIASIPGSPFQIAVQNNSMFVADNGVVFSPSGTALTPVTGSPGPGQYKVAAGIYTFNAADITKTVRITYQIKDTEASDAATQLNFTFFPGTLGQAVWGYMSSKHPDQALGYSQIAYIASAALDLGSGASLPNYTFEVLGINSYGSGIVDCDPADCILTMLTDPALGIGSNGQTQFPLSAIGDLTQASNFWIANNFFISPLVENQREASGTIRDWLEAGQTAAFFSEGKLKLVPYGDVSAAGNGVIYQPQTQPVEDLDDDDFVPESEGADPIKVSRTPLSEANNRTQVQWANRAAGYNPEVTQEQDDAAINRFGVRAEQPVNWDFITTQAAATFAANLRLKRSIYIRNTYSFTLDWTHAYLEPMDLVTLTTLNDPFFTKLPVRITKIEDDPEKGLKITAEDFPWGTATPSLYAKQPALPFFPAAGLADPGPTTALIIEAPDPLVANNGHILYIFCSPTNNMDWGGCEVFVSLDDTEYDWYGIVTAPARIGTLGANLAAGTVDPDPSTALVNITDAILGSASQAAFDSFVTLAALFNSSPTAKTTPVDLSGNIPAPYFPNLNFEQSSVIPPPGWAISATSAVYDTATPFQGTRSLKLTSTAIYGGVVTDPANWRPVTPGQFFSGSIWVKGDGHQLYFTISLYAPDKTTFIGNLSSYTGTTSTAWTQLFASGIVPSGVGWIHLNCFTTDSVTVVFEVDAAVITEGGYNLIGIYSDGTSFSSTGGLDGAGHALSSNLLGTHITFDGAPYNFGLPNVNNVVQCTGQVINLPAGKYQSIWFLVAAVGPVNGQQNQTYTVTFSDGTTQTLTQSTSSWLVPQTYAGEFPAFNSLNYRNKYDGTKDGSQPSFLYNFSWNLTPGKTVAAVTLPNNANLMVVAISLAVDSTSYNLELFAYRDATLTAANQYSLTPLHRGLYGTKNLAHLTGESFVRMDQASIQWPYDALYVGKTVYFKFLSFNTMGANEQALPDVSPISFTLEGSGPGAIDALSGSYLPGLDQVPNGTYVFKRTAAHSSYRPTSNPLTAHDAGSSATINIAAFFMRSPGYPDVSLSSGAITNLAYGTMYFVYYLDLFFLGGAVAYLVATSKETVLQNAAAFFVGSIRTPLAGGADTIGNNDGGAGAQTGSNAKILFTTLNSVVGAVSNPSYMMDGDPTTQAVLSVSAPPNAGPNTGTGADTFFPAGNPNWATPTNISGNPASWTTTTVPVNNGSSILNCTNFGFSIPAGATVLGIRVDWAGAVGYNYGNHSWIGLGLLKGGVRQGFGGPIYMTSNVATAYFQGNELDTMGISFTPADINASNFGVYIQAFNDSSAGGSQNFLLQTLVVKVYYALVSNQEVIVQTIPAFTQVFSGLKMKVTYSIPTNTLNGTGARATLTFIAGGTTLGTINWNAGQTTAIRTDSFDCPLNASPSSFEFTIVVFSSTGSSVGTITVNVIDVWVEGNS